MKTRPETLHDGRFLRLMQRGRWEYAERTNPGGAVAIIALTPEGKLLLVEQYRPALQAPVIELPAGLVGDSAAFAGESWRTTAARELEEETGYRAGRFEWLTEGPTSAGLSNEIVILVRAFELERTGSGGGDEFERITVHEVAPEAAHAWLAAREADGLRADPKVYAGLYFVSSV